MNKTFIYLLAQHICHVDGDCIINNRPIIIVITEQRSRLLLLFSGQITGIKRFPTHLTTYTTSLRKVEFYILTCFMRLKDFN